MIIATGLGTIYSDHESVTEFDRVVTELAQLFRVNTWKWSGAVPDRSDVAWRLTDLVTETVKRAAGSADGYASVCGGRLFVEARRAGTGESDTDPQYALTIGVKLHLS